MLGLIHISVEHALFARLIFVGLSVRVDRKVAVFNLLSPCTYS